MDLPQTAATWIPICTAPRGVIALLPRDRGRLIAPTIRGFGESVFKRDDAPRTANSGILAKDAIALMGGLGMEPTSVSILDMGAPSHEFRSVGSARKRWRWNKSAPTEVCLVSTTNGSKDT